MHSTFSGLEALQVDANHMHLKLVLSSAIPDGDKREQKREIGRYASIRTLLVDHKEKQRNLKNGCYTEL